MFATYKPSGKFAPVYSLYILLCVLPMLILAYIYMLGLEWIPFIYINGLLTAGMGLSAGFLTILAVNYGKVRNILLATAGAIFLSIAGLGGKFYFQYLADRAQLEIFLNQMAEELPDDQSDAKQELRDGLKDYGFFDHIAARVDQGWRVGKGQGAPISGVFVYLVWLIEAGIILGISGLMAIHAASEPFSEKLNQWADEKEQIMVLPINDPQMVARITSAQSVEDLLNIPIPKSDQSNQFAIYTVNSIPGQEWEDAYLSVELQTTTTNKKGETEVDKKSLVQLAILTAEQRQQLQENAILLQEAILEYQKSLHAAPNHSEPA